MINQKKNETPKIDFHQASHSKYPSIVIHHAVKKTPARYVSFIYFYLPPKNVTQVGKRIYIYLLHRHSLCFCKTQYVVPCAQRHKLCMSEDATCADVQRESQLVHVISHLLFKVLPMLNKQSV